MLKNKKAQGISLETIIVAAIVLIVLVVLVMVFTGQMGWFNKGLYNATQGRSCENSGGHWCESDNCPIQNRVIGKFSNEDDYPDQVCCNKDYTCT